MRDDWTICTENNKELQRSRTSQPICGALDRGLHKAVLVRSYFHTVVVQAYGTDPNICFNVPSPYHYSGIGACKATAQTPCPLPNRE